MTPLGGWRAVSWRADRSDRLLGSDTLWNRAIKAPPLRQWPRQCPQLHHPPLQPVSSSLFALSNHSLSVRDVLISSFSLPPPSRVMSFDMRRKCGPLTLETQLVCTEMSSLFQTAVSHTHSSSSLHLLGLVPKLLVLCVGILHLCGVIYQIIFPYYTEGMRKKDYLLTI